MDSGHDCRACYAGVEGRFLSACPLHGRFFLGSHLSCRIHKGQVSFSWGRINRHIKYIGEARSMGQGVNIHRLQEWVGKSESCLDQIAHVPIAALSATLDREDPFPRDGEALPPLWHWLYFLPLPRQSEIDSDGHSKRGGFLPPVPLPRRMFAGGRTYWHHPLRVGGMVTRNSRISDVTHKEGRTSHLVFVTVHHEISSSGHIALTEEWDIVYPYRARSGDLN